MRRAAQPAATAAGQQPVGSRPRMRSLGRFSPRVSFRRINRRRRGALAVFAAVLLVPLMAFAAFAVDVGYMNLVRTELQRTADASAMAAALELTDDRTSTGIMQAEQEALALAGLNEPGHGTVANEGDVTFGVWNFATRTFTETHVLPNAVRVMVQRDAARSNAAPLFCARVLGFDEADVSASAIAVMEDRYTVGVRVGEEMPNSSLLPYAISKDAWDDLLAGNGLDNWAYDPDTGQLSLGSDGLPELQMFPDTGTGPGVSGITPGNFGTIDIGDPNNSHADLVRQITEGVSADDLEWHGGELRLDSYTGTLSLNGDTGVDGIDQRALREIVGQPRILPLYREVTDPGNTATFTIVGFAGVRVVDYQATGALQNMHITIQVAPVVDRTAITDPGMGEVSYYVYPGAQLVR